MSPNRMTEILRLAAEGKLPRVVDGTTPEMLNTVRQLYRAGLIEVKDASADAGECYLQPEITVAGLAYLKT